MKIDVVYCKPLERFGDQHHELAVRFRDSYMTHEAGVEHTLVVVSNGGEPSEQTKELFTMSNPVEIIVHDGSAMDIGAYQAAAARSTADMIVFFGGSTYIRTQRWLARMVEVFNKHGDTLYGCMGNQGNDGNGVSPHVRTTGFWCSAKLFNDYPEKVTHHSQRYTFEHGESGLTSWVIKQGKKVYIVGVEGEWPVEQCDLMTNGFHSGRQENLIVGDRLTTRPHFEGI